jgi:hypothetical protein
VAVQQTARYLEQALGEPAPWAAAPAHAQARRRIGGLSIDFQRAMAEPDPVRQQVTAWLPAVMPWSSCLRPSPPPR